MIGSCCRISWAAFRPSSTSCAGVYLLLGATMRVCADGTAPTRKVKSTTRRVTRFIKIALCKSASLRVDYGRDWPWRPFHFNMSSEGDDMTRKELVTKLNE